MSAPDPHAEDEVRWRDLMVRAQAGEAEAYRTLLGEVYAVGERYLRRILGDSAAVEDCLQEALTAVHRARASYDPRRPFRPWLFTIVRHKAIDALRREGARPEVATEELPVSAAPGVAPGDWIDADRLVAGLKPEFREALMLTKVHGMTVDEAARKAGVSPSALRTRLHRAIRHLNRQMQDDLARFAAPGDTT